jgi:hypothetical protein
MCFRVAIIRVNMGSIMEAFEGPERGKNVTNMYLEGRV